MNSIKHFMSILNESNDLVPMDHSREMAPADHTIHDLPILFTDALRDSGSMAHVHWRTIGSLTGMFGKGLQMLGHDLFKHWTSTPLNDILVVTAVDGKNSDAEFVTALKFLEREGHRVDDADVSMAEIIPGYKAHVTVFGALGFEFMVVKDAAGRYVYAYEAKQLAAPVAMDALAAPKPALPAPGIQMGA